jgi:hypothetical protein
MNHPFERLRDELEHAFNTEPERTSPEEERKRYIWALTRISQFLKKTLGAKTSAKRIYELAAAFDDLDDGRVDPLLKPSDLPTSASATRIWCDRAKIAVVIDAYIVAGLKRDQAAKRVADNVPELDKLAAFERRRDPSSTTTKALNWYDEFKKPRDKSRIKNKAALDLFQLGRELTARRLSVKDVDGFAERYLRGIGRIDDAKQ